MTSSSSSGAQPALATALKLEMAYVLFMDIVSYSLLPMDEQARILAELQDTVQTSTAGKLRPMAKMLVESTDRRNLFIATLGKCSSRRLPSVHDKGITYWREAPISAGPLTPTTRQPNTLSPVQLRKPRDSDPQHFCGVI